VPLWKSAVGGDTEGPDEAAERTLRDEIVAALGGYAALGRSTSHGTNWYRAGLHSDDNLWSLNSNGKGPVAGSVSLLLRGAFLTGLDDRGLSAARSLVAMGGRVRRADLMADSENAPGALYAVYRLLEDRVVTLPAGLTWKWLSENGKGHTLYLGSTRSDHYVALYDKRGLDRIELRVRDEAAEAVVDAWLMTGDARGILSKALDRYGAVLARGPGAFLRTNLEAGDGAARQAWTRRATRAARWD
jgi:hypothetical protein